MKTQWLFAAILAAAPMAAQGASLINGGFETGDLSGWSVLGWPAAGVASSSQGYGPVEGSKFAVIGTNDPQVTEGIYQYLDFNGEQTLRGYAAFSTRDFPPFNSSAYVRLYMNQYDYYTLFSESVATVGAFGRTPWESFSILPAAGHYRLEAYVYDPSSDAELGSTLFLDGLSMSVPEPAGWSLLISGFALGGLGLRRREASRRASRRAA